MKFEDLDLAPEVMRGIRDAGFVECTPVQAQALPWTLEGDDLAGQAQTGTGKTACFLITAFTRLLESEHLARPGRPRAICLAPTRELAIQIADDAAQLGRYTDLKFATIYGGVGFDKQRHAIRKGIDLCIATPGRFIDFVRRGEIALTDCEVAVVDEADRMFDMGFINDLRYILRKLPKKSERQMLLFSATMSMRVTDLGYQFMQDPREVSIEPDTVVVDAIDATLYHVGQSEKFSLLLGLYAHHSPTKSIVFCNRKATVERVARRLSGNDITAAAIIGDMPQKKRQQVIERFKTGDLQVLVATDVASRGLHVDDVTHVYNYDVPQDPEDYVHRVGRTGRAGNTGTAVMLACEEYVLGLPALEKYVGHKIPVARHDDGLLAEDKSPPIRSSSRGRGRQRGRDGARDLRAGRRRRRGSNSR
ncbi:MAG: DEAD/DEAH box helicase [Myxococcota bacterium]|nr:DEAD/DEAH box helicase [Myxococcota bacterium]